MCAFPRGFLSVVPGRRNTRDASRVLGIQSSSIPQIPRFEPTKYAATTAAATAKHRSRTEGNSKCNPPV